MSLLLENSYSYSTQIQRCVTIFFSFQAESCLGLYVKWHEYYFIIGIINENTRTQKSAKLCHLKTLQL